MAQGARLDEAVTGDAGMGTALDQGQCSGRLTSRARALDMEPAIVVTKEHPLTSIAALADVNIFACVGHGWRVAFAYSRSCSLL